MIFTYISNNIIITPINYTYLLNRKIFQSFNPLTETHSSEIDSVNLLLHAKCTRALLTLEKNQFIDDSMSSTLISCLHNA